MKEVQKTRLFIAGSIVIILCLLVFVIFVDLIFPVSQEEVYMPGLSLGKDDQDSSAPVIIEEYSDFQCAFCDQALPALRQVKRTYREKVNIVFKHFPISEIHPFAMQAAEAAECARDQGKFWAYHDTIFENQNSLQEDMLINYAEEEGLDIETFKECLDSGSKKRIVQQDLKEGAELGVQGTPTFFINGRKIEGTQPFSAFKQIIDEELGNEG